MNLVPQIAQPLKNDKLVTVGPAKPSSRWERVENTMADIAKSNSKEGNAQQAYGREAINKGMQKAQEGAQKANALRNTNFNKLVASPLGWPFRYSFDRSANLVVLSAPYSRISLICNAVTALVNLATFSLKEDEIGRFHEGVPAIIRVFTTAITLIDEYMAKAEIHWSDQESLSKPEAERKTAPKVEEVRECLREGLERTLGSFNEYLASLGLEKKEIVEAKRAAGAKKAPEMIQARGVR